MLLTFLQRFGLGALALLALASPAGAAVVARDGSSRLVVADRDRAEICVDVFESDSGTGMCDRAPLRERRSAVVTMSENRRLLAGGHTNAEIASGLYVSLRTVEAHRSRLRAKLGLHSRAELSTYAREHGLVR